jgi:hypothetical protein
MKLYPLTLACRQRGVLFGFLSVLILTVALFAQTPPKPVYVPYRDAQPILKQLDEILPPALKGKSPEPQAASWTNWVTRRDSEIRARLVRGDEDSLVNFLSFGTSYTKEPRLSPRQLAELGRKADSTGADTGRADLTRTLLLARIGDLIKGAASPGNNERLLFSRRFLTQYKGFNLETIEGRTRAKEYLLDSMHRILSESEGYTKVLEQARLLGSATVEFVERSKLYNTRGLSSDTSLLPNFAIEESLKAIQEHKLLLPGTVRRVAIIGPGLDFTDKQEGYDFYPQQTIQPFAIIDTLRRLGLAHPQDLKVTTFDLSPRVNHHLAQAIQRARHGQNYVVQLPRDPQEEWRQEPFSYWEHFGDQIGKPVPAASVPAVAGSLNVRAVSILATVVEQIRPVDLNIVLQRLELTPTEQFDLIIATNIFVYYDVFEQSLAMANVERMLRPGGFMLSNNALIEFPFSKMRSVGYLTVVYSARPNDGDHIVWYRSRE